MGGYRKEVGGTKEEWVYILKREFGWEYCRKEVGGNIEDLCGNTVERRWVQIPVSPGGDINAF